MVESELNMFVSKAEFVRLLQVYFLKIVELKFSKIINTKKKITIKGINFRLLL
jgi:hypothetical protein